MTKHIGRALAVLTGTMLAGAMLATPANATTAQDDTELPSDRGDSEYLSVTITVTDNCAATITYTNSVPDGLPGSWAYWGDYRVGDEEGAPDSDFPPLPRDDDGQLIIEDYADAHDHGVTPEQQITVGPLAGTAFGLQYNPVLIHRGATRTVNVEVDAPTTLAAWIKRGPEQEWYVGEVNVEVPCERTDDDDDDADNVDDGKDDDAGAGGGDADDNDTLPVTGAPAALIAGAGAALLGAGLVLWWAMKRRTPKFDV